MKEHFRFGYTSVKGPMSATSLVTKNQRWQPIILIYFYFIHGRIIKWTQHIGFLTLAEIAQVIEGNHGYHSKEG